MVNDTIGSPGPYDPLGPSRVGPITLEIKIVIKLGKTTRMGAEEPRVLIISSGPRDASGRRIYPYYIPHFSLDRLIIEVLTLREPTTGEESQVAFVKLIGIDGKFDHRAGIYRASVGVLDWPGMTISEEQKHK